MQAAGQIHAELQRLDQGLGPIAADHAAAIGDADDDRLHPGGLGLLDGHVGDVEIGLAARQAKLARAALGAPEGNAVGRLGGELVVRLADKHQIGMRNRHVETRPAVVAKTRPHTNGEAPDSKSHCSEMTPGLPGWTRSL